ncbi:hypothetical protein [Nocardiopsis sp. LOL_012]|uniref:hypothetical protein n=1 Tax=Nocardiopsis sp. LOL_012 TaxID=3345409 RepID=UPI003A85BCD5
MGVATRGLRGDDPRQLGGFRLLGRADTSPVGVVFLGRDASGAEVSVAVLHSGAGADPRARERFVRAVRGRDDVLAARTRGRSVLWVALPGAASAAGEVLREVAEGGPVVADGPVVLPYWAGERPGAAARWAPRQDHREAGAGPGERNWWLVGALAAFLVFLLLLVTALYWWMLQFPPPEMPPPGPIQIEPEDAEEGESASPVEEEPAPQTPRPSTEGEDLEGDPEDHL